MNANRDDFSKKREQLIDILNEYPDSLVFIDLSDMYIETGDHNVAIDILKEGEKRHPDYPELLFRLGILYRKTGELNDALSYLKKYLEFNRYDLRALLAYGNILIEMERPEDEILKHYAKIHTLFPENKETKDIIERFTMREETTEETPTISLIKLYWTQGYLLKAKDLCKKLLVSEPDNTTAQEIQRIITKQLTEQQNLTGEINFEIPQPMNSYVNRSGEFIFTDLPLTTIRPGGVEISKDEVVIESYDLPEMISIGNFNIDELGSLYAPVKDTRVLSGELEVVFSTTPPFNRMRGITEFDEFNIRTHEDKTSESPSKIPDEDETIRDWLDRLMKE